MNKRQKRRKQQQRNQTALRAKTVLINEPPKKETTMHKSTLEFLAFLGKAFLIALTLVLIAIFGLWQCRPAFANATDWYNNSISEQISQQARAEARKLWREENGDWQPNLTPQAEQELLHYTAQKQKELDRGKQ